MVLYQNDKLNLTSYVYYTLIEQSTGDAVTNQLDCQEQSNFKNLGPLDMWSAEQNLTIFSHISSYCFSVI